MRDTFDKSTDMPTQVRSIEITVRVTEGSPNTYDARYTFDQLNAQGRVTEIRSGSLVPHLTAAQRQAMRDLMDALLIKAKGSV